MPTTQTPFLLEPFPIIIKWLGNKRQEISQLTAQFPSDFENFYEPFLGGGACYLGLNFKHAFVNDICPELINVFLAVKNQNPQFFNLIENINNLWKTLDVGNFSPSFIEMKTFLEQQEKTLYQLFSVNSKSLTISPALNKTLKVKFKKAKKNKNKLNTLIRSQIYTTIRNLYNSNLPPIPAIAAFTFLREFCFSGMFRFNQLGQYNVPYSGASYNHKTLDKKIEQWKNTNLIKHMKKTTFECQDFEKFLKQHPPTSSDFIFLDPPYDETYNNYVKNPFVKSDQERLAQLAKSTPSKFLLIIKDTPLIRHLYKGFNFIQFDKRYDINLKGRNNNLVTHLCIQNY